MTTAPNRLIEAARRRQDDVTRRIIEATTALERRGETLTIAAVGREAHVSRTSIYARPDLLERLQAPATPRDRGAPEPSTERGAMVRRLEVSQDRNRKLHRENERLRRELANALGEVRLLRQHANPTAEHHKVVQQAVGQLPKCGNAPNSK